MAKRNRSLFGLGLLVAAGGAFFWVRRLLEGADGERAQMPAGGERPLAPAPVQKATIPLPPAPDPEAPADDLTDINGIGATYARRLRAAGVRTFADLATLTPEQALAAAKAQAWQADPAEWIAQAKSRA